MTAARRRARMSAESLGDKFDAIPGQLALVRTCESHGNGALATHRVDFLTSPPFFVCASCADDAASRGIKVRPLESDV